VWPPNVEMKSSSSRP